MVNVYSFSAKTIDGTEKPLADYSGEVLLIVNTASKCGFTPQYEQLEELYKKYMDKGFSVLGFPCNQFLNQEPGSEEEIESFCRTEYGVTFPMFAKVKVNGKDQHPLYEYLTKNTKGFLNGAIKWNFTKFLVNRNGEVVKRYPSAVKPEDIQQDIEDLL